jgi:predicted nucleic acid-binding protein
LLTSTLILAEVHRVLLLRAGIRPARLALERIFAARLLTVVYPTAKHDLAARGWLDHLSDRRVSYAGAMSFAIMEDARADVAFSFDDDFVAAGFRLWTCR